ncbi:MAG: FAD-binding domain-containing protein [Halieaceae bacterium]|nr:FAD-binding domain-containing protein [Halieaceae bacterium]
MKSWKQGDTGIPLIDAGMRELCQTGHMHNRVPMITASFLVKNLLIDWREGQKWFWDCLLDADLASNSAGWQWVAGSGVDAAPYFRIFNPVSQGKKYDLEGLYIRKFVPELSQIPNKFIHDPWNAPPEILEKANVILCQNYSFPIVDLKESRQRALSAYSEIKGANNL